MSAAYRNETVTLEDGCRMHYQDWGSTAAPPLLMVHGLTQHSHSFDAVAHHLKERFRCIAVDVRGRGESDWAEPRTYHYEQYAQDIEFLLQRLGLEQVHWMGVSMGGQIGMILAAERPQRFRSLVLDDIAPELDPRGAARIAEYVKHVPASFPDFEACIDWAVAQYPWLQGIPREAVGQAVQWAVRRQPDGSYRFRFDPAIIQASDPTDAERQKRTIQRMWQGLRNLTCPLMVVRGADSDVLHPDTVKQMQHIRPDLTLVEVPGMGHAPTLGEQLVKDALDRFYA